MRKQKGFSLIELLIVVTIILIIAGIAVPSLLRSRIAANEASAVGSLRAISTAEVTYAATYPNFGFTDLANLGGTGNGATSTNALLLDPVLGCPAGVAAGAATTAAACQKSGYFLYTKITLSDGSFTVGPSSAYSVNADPVTQDKTGKRYFYTDGSNSVIRFATGSIPAAATDSALQ